MISSTGFESCDWLRDGMYRQNQFKMVFKQTHPWPQIIYQKVDENPLLETAVLSFNLFKISPNCEQICCSLDINSDVEMAET